MKVMVRLAELNLSSKSDKCKSLKLSNTNSIQGLFVLALAICCLLSDVSAAPLPAPLLDPLSATIGAAGGVFYCPLENEPLVVFLISSEDLISSQVG